MNQEPIINNQGVAPASTGEINTEQDAIERAAVKQAELVNYEKNKANKGLLFGLILCLILAIGGIGFGVYEMIDGNAKVDKLNKQNSALQVQNNELAEKLAALQGEGKDENTADYIYVGEWGMKIKIPEGNDLRDFISSYTYKSGYPNVADGLEIIENNNGKAGGGVFISVYGGITTTDECSGDCIGLGDKIYSIEKINTGEEEVSDAFYNFIMDPDNYSIL